jgi:hypothetical protein
MAGVGCLSPLVFGDQIISDVAFLNDVRIVGFSQGNLEFVDEDNRLAAIDLLSVGRLVIDDDMELSDLNEAERLMAAGDAAKSTVYYIRAARQAKDFWRLVIRVRVQQAATKAGRLEEAMGHLILLMRGDSDSRLMAARMIPHAFDPEEPEIRKVLNRIEMSLAQTASRDSRTMLRVLQFAILESLSDASAPSAAREAVEKAVPLVLATDGLMRWRTAASGKLLVMGDFDAVISAVDMDLLVAPQSILPELMRLKGLALYHQSTDDETTRRAALSLMRVPIHFPSHPLTPECLYWTAEPNNR